MLTVEGVYRDGKVELFGTVDAERQGRVLVTFLEDSGVDLSALGIDESEAAELRSKFASFDDWNDPVMDVYNNYDNAESTLN